MGSAVEAAAREALYASGVGLDDAGDDTADRIDVLAGGVGQLCDLAVTQFYALSDKQRQAIAVSQGGVAKWCCAHYFLKFASCIFFTF